MLCMTRGGGEEPDLRRSPEGETPGVPLTATAVTTSMEKEEVASKVPMVSWVSLAMLLLVYVSNQWTRSLIYCEWRVRRWGVALWGGGLNISGRRGPSTRNRQNVVLIVQKKQMCT